MIDWNLLKFNTILQSLKAFDVLLKKYQPNFWKSSNFEDVWLGLLVGRTTSPCALGGGRGCGLQRFLFRVWTHLCATDQACLNLVCARCGRPPWFLCQLLAAGTGRSFLAHASSICWNLDFSSFWRSKKKKKFEIWIAKFKTFEVGILCDISTSHFVVVRHGSGAWHFFTSSPSWWNSIILLSFNFQEEVFKKPVKYLRIFFMTWLYKPLPPILPQILFSNNEFSSF